MNRKTPLLVDSHSAAALLAMASNTGWTSVGELLMTCRISLVAVCCSRASLSARLCAWDSWNRRAFPIAITAWSAKVVRRWICCSENGSDFPPRTTIAPSTRPSWSIGTASVLRNPAARAASPKS